MDHGKINVNTSGAVAGAQKIIEQLRFKEIDVNIICSLRLGKDIVTFEWPIEELMADTG